MDKPAFPTADTEKMLSLPVGALSPLWLMFAGAATVGAAWYWSRTFFKPTNLEALIALPETAAETAVEAAAETVELAEVVVEATAEVVEATLEVAADVAETLVEAAPAPVAELAVAMAFEPVAPIEPDDLTRLTGVGPKLAASLAERGVTRFAQIAAWTDDDVAAFDKDMKLMGRIAREAWIAQATRLAAH
ncbi:MAG: hypothetical protein Q8L23_06065 [Caulobacter sp.]|nr:hypothetical protein [Caulobacter sp.]